MFFKVPINPKHSVLPEPLQFSGQISGVWKLVSTIKSRQPGEAGAVQLELPHQEHGGVWQVELQAEISPSTLTRGQARCALWQTLERVWLDAATCSVAPGGAESCPSGNHSPAAAAVPAHQPQPLGGGLPPSLIPA